MALIQQCCNTLPVETGGGNVIGPAVLNRLSLALPANTLLQGVSISCRGGTPFVTGNQPLPIGFSPIQMYKGQVINYSVTDSKDDLSDFNVVLAVGDSVDLIWTYHI